MTCHIPLHVGQVFFHFHHSPLQTLQVSFLLNSIFSFHQKILVFKSILKIYCKSSQGDSFLFLLGPLENHHQKKELRISHKSISTHENPPLKGFSAQEVLQNISYCFLFPSSDNIS
ncbi:MAG: hypothetical protein LBQ24_07635 [Candidatus Peribacteria bacterium]|nr:hypothetical protein [Candidatus Peribacteria bacterium]